jgi:indole-3-acetate monooxygenase
MPASYQPAPWHGAVAMARLLEALMATTNLEPARNSFDAVAEREPLSDGATRLLAAVRDLAPDIAARADEIERGRRVPGDIVEALRRIGVFRMLVPHSHGGLALSVPELVPVIEALSAIDSSVGWVTMIAVTSQTFCTRLSRRPAIGSMRTIPMSSWLA